MRFPALIPLNFNIRNVGISKLGGHFCLFPKHTKYMTFIKNIKDRNAVGVLIWPLTLAQVNSNRNKYQQYTYNNHTLSI